MSCRSLDWSAPPNMQVSYSILRQFCYTKLALVMAGTLQSLLTSCGYVGSSEDCISSIKSNQSNWIIKFYVRIRFPIALEELYKRAVCSTIEVLRIIQINRTPYCVRYIYTTLVLATIGAFKYLKGIAGVYVSLL